MAIPRTFLSVVLLLAWANADCCTHAQETADIIIFNAKVLTCDKDFRQAPAFAIKGKRILQVGSKQDLEPFATEETKWLDLAGKCITPGFTDSHLHYVGLGSSLQNLDLRDAKNWPEVVELVKAKAATVPAGTWITGRGWHQEKWSPLPENNVEGYPLHDPLSAAVPEHPVMLTHASGHACLANANAMQLAGVGSATKDPNGGEIIRDEEGNPIGVFRENAQGLIRAAMPTTERGTDPDSAAEAIALSVALAGQNCISHGITSVHDAGISFEQASALKTLADRGELPVRLYTMIREPSSKLAVKMPTARLDMHESGRLMIRSVKVSIDGALGPHGAWLLQPYEDLPQSTGLNTVTIEELERIASLCKEHSWQLCVHAIGDRANQEVLDAYEKILGESAQSTDHRWRIEHAQHIAAEDLPRFNELKVIPAMQANHCTSDALFVIERLGLRRAAQGAYMWRDLIDLGCIIPNGTDAPVEPINPIVSLHASVTRELKDGATFFPEQCMTRQEALWSYTLWPAQASFNEHHHGSIAAGLVADFVVWDQDLLRVDAKQLKSARPLETWIDGQRVYFAK